MTLKNSCIAMGYYFCVSCMERSIHGSSFKACAKKVKINIFECFFRVKSRNIFSLMRISRVRLNKASFREAKEALEFFLKFTSSRMGTFKIAHI